VAWAGRSVWHTSHPMVAAARELRSSDPSERANAIRTLSDMGSDSGGEVIRTVLPVLADPAADARAAAAETLGVVGASTALSASGSDATRTVVTALTALLTDREPSVRGKAASALGVIAAAAAWSSRG